MNEQALQDAYTLFQQEGYNNSFDEFVNLINSNDQALQDVYNLFTQTGYNKSFDEFNTLIGVKKKDDTSELVSPSETVSTEPTSPTVLPQQDVPGDSDSQVTEPDFAELAMGLEVGVETQPSYMQAPGIRPEKVEQQAIDQLAEEQGWSKMPTAPQDLEEYFSKITSLKQDDPDSMFEGIIAGGLLEMPELEKEKLSRIAEGESYFLDQEKANAALQYDEEYRAEAADAAKGLVLIEDDVTNVFLNAQALNAEGLDVNALRDLKEQYTQQLPEKRRATVESMDLEDFVQYTAETRMRRQFAEAFMGMSGLSDMDLQVKVGKMRGDIDAARSFKEEGSWAAKKWSNSWESKMGEWGSGGKFARAKASVELLEDDLKDIDSVLGIYGRAPSEDELIQIGRMVYKGDTSDLAGDLNDEISTRQMPLSGPNSDAGRKALIEQGMKAFKLNRNWWESKKKELEGLRDKKQKVGEYYARDFAEIQAFRDVTSKLIDQKVMSEEDLNKGAIESLFEGDYELFGYKTVGLIFDIAPDMAKGIGAATVGSLVAGPTGGRVAMSLAFGLQTEDQTAGEYASRPEVTGIEAVEMAKKEGAIEAGISFLFAGLQTKQAAIVTKASEEVAEVFAKGGSRESLRAAREAVQAFAKTEAGIKVLDVLGEGTEEALITGLSQYTRAVNEVGQGRMTAEEATAEYRNLYEIGDSFYAGVLGGGATSIPFVLSRGTSAIGSKFTMFDRIKIQTEMEEIRTKLSDPNTTAEEKKELNARFTKLHDDANRLSRKDIEFYQNMTEEDQNRLVELNQRISNVRRTSRQAVTSLAALRNRIRRAESPEQKRAMEAELNQLTSAEAQRRTAVEADIRTLMQEKLEIENKYGSTDSGFDADVEKEQRNRAEIERMVNEVLNVDKGFEGLFSALGVKGIKKGSIRLTAENVDVVLQRLLDGNIRGTRFATAEQIKEGIKSALSMAKAVIADNPDAEVLIVDSLTQWKKETRDANNPDGYSVSLGIHIPSDGGKIVLYAPALRANTAYHEGFHQMVYRMMQKSGVDRGAAMIRLASVIRKGMSPELLEKYGSFVGMYKDPNDPFNDALLAEEFLAEVFGDLADGAIDIKFQKGIVSSFLQFLNQALKERNIRVTGTPLTQDIAVAIKDAANAFRAGEGGAQENILLAFDAADNIVLTPGLEALRAKLEVRRHRKALAQASNELTSDDSQDSRAHAQRIEEPSVLGDWTNEFLRYDSNGNVRLFHVGPENLEGNFIDPRRFGQQPYTKDKRGDKVSMFYVRPEDRERMVLGRTYDVTIPPQMLYDLFKDPLNLYETAKAEFQKKHSIAFDGNRQAEWIGYEARKLGFDGIVVKWRNTARVDMWAPVTPDEFGGYTPQGSRIGEADIRVISEKDNYGMWRNLSSRYKANTEAHVRMTTGAENQVTELSEEEVSKLFDEGAKFVTADALGVNAIGYVTADGYIGGLSKNPEGVGRGVQAALLGKRVELGGTHLECFATYLEGNNIREGFVPVARIPFNEELAPKGWDAETSLLKDKPDLVFMAYDPAAAKNAKPGDGARLDDYMEALNMAIDRVARVEEQQDVDEQFITKKKPGERVKAQKMERQWLASNTPKLVNAGILMHGTSAEFTEFSMRKATESTGMYGKGVYMTHNVDKALSYGGNFVFVDGERLDLANLQSKEVADKFLNSVLSKETEGGLGLAAIAAGKAKRPVGLVGKYDLFSLEYQVLLMYSGLDVERVMGTDELRPRYDFERLQDPVEFVESIYEEMYKLAEGVNIPMSSAEQLSSFGLNGIRSHMTGRSMGMVPGLGGFVRNVFRTYNNRLSERRIDPKDFENDELKYDVAIALIEGAYMTQVIRAGYDGVYVSREFDYGGSMERLDDTKFTESGVEGGLAQEAIIFNNTLLNQSIVEFEDVIPLADSRISQGRTRTEKGGELGTDLMLNDRMRALGAVKRQGPALNEYMDNYDSEVADFVDSESIPVKVRSEQDLSRMESIMIDVLEFFYDKFYRALRIQREIQKGRGGRRVMREQDYEMALALIDGKASGRLQSVDKFMEQLAGVMNKYGILHDQLGQFLYAMHAPNRNAVIAERMANSLNAIRSEIEELQEQVNREENVEEKGKLQKKLKDKRDKAQEIEARMEGGNFSGMTDQEAAELVEALDSEGMREAYQMVMDFQKETRQLIVEYGLETQKTIDMLEAVYPSYVPLSGFAMDEDANEVGYANMHQARVFRGIRRAEGRKSEARNPLDHIFERRYQTVLAGEKNVANTRLLNLLAANPDPSMYRIFGPKDKLPGVVGRKTPMTEAEARRDERFVEVVVNGESFFIRFESEAVARAVNKHNITRLGDGVHKYVQKTFQMIRSFGRFMSMSFTSWSPDFVGQNFIRDLQFGLGSLLAEQEIAGGQAYGEKIVKDAAKGVYPALKFLGKTIVGGVEDVSDPLYRYYKEFSERGATTDWPYQKNADQFRSDIETLTNAQNPNLKTKATELLKATGRLVDGVNKSVENAVRFAAFVAARKAGVDAEAAAYLAKELTINFNRSGSGGSVVNAIYLFFNAGVQGTAKFVRTMGTLKKVPDGRGGYYKTLNSAQMVAAGMSGFAFLMAFVNEAMSGEDEDGRSHYEKIPDYVKERNMIFMNPFDEEGKDHFAIPLPYGYNIFHNAGTVGAEAAMGIRSAGSAGMFLTGGMVNSFIPVSFGQSSSVAKKTVKAFTPTFLRPWMEWAINESYFGTPVYNENFPGQNLPASSLASRSPEWLRETAKFLNEATGGNEFEAGWLDADPDVAAYIFQYYTGGTGRFLEKVSKSVDNSISLLAGESDIRAGEIASDLPLFGKLYGTPNARQDVADYYKFRTNVRTKAKAAKELGLDDEKYRYSVILNDIGVNADRQLKENRRLMRAVQDNDKLDPQVKARDIETLERERMQIIYNFNREYLKYYERRKTD